MSQDAPFSTDHFNVKCIERDMGYSITILCKNENCLKYYKHPVSGLCLICENICKGHRTSRTFHFGSESDSEKTINSKAEFASYSCHACGSKEFISPFDSITTNVKNILTIF